MDNEKIYPHQFEMKSGTSKFSDCLVCVKCGYITYQANDGDIRMLENPDLKKSDYRRENIPKSCII